MHVLLVSACEKRAKRRTRAVLDSYAVRTSESSWATPITVEALDECRVALRRGATRQTAVACYANIGRRRMKLLWVVGARGRFAADGHFPAGTTMASAAGRARAAAPMPNWLRLASLLVRGAGLMHDIGKASTRFQDKLRADAPRPGGDDIRHEWLSMRLLQELRGGGRWHWQEAWRRVAATPTPSSRATVVLGARPLDSTHRESVSSWAEALDFLVVSHHGLLQAQSGLNGGEAMPTPEGRHVRRDASPDQLTPAGDLPQALFDEQRAIEARIAADVGTGAPPSMGFWRALTMLARPALVMADHVVSQETVGPDATRPAEPGDGALYANTVALPGAGASSGRRTRRLNQALDWHLREVGRRSVATLHGLAASAGWPSTVAQAERALPGLRGTTVDAILAPPRTPPRFIWQGHAAEALRQANERRGRRPTLVFNLAGTGAGKTRMNVRAACLLARPDAPVRLSIGLNLRTLTLQTGHALESALGLAGDEMAVVIGDATAHRLFDAATGEAASQPNKTAADEAAFQDDDENPVEAEIEVIGATGALPDWLDGFAADPRRRRLLAAPLLVSTIDQIVRAGEPAQQGHHVAALTRVMSSELILDEIDGYEPTSLAAVLRVVQAAAFAGRSVVCSSATLSRPVAEAVQRAYCSGVELRRQLEAPSSSGPPVTGHRVALIDDRLESEVLDIDGGRPGDAAFGQAYAMRLQRMSEALEGAPVRRLAELVDVAGRRRVGDWLEAVTDACLRMHDRWAADPGGATPAAPTCRVSFGLVRVANVRHAVLTARHLAARLPHAWVACYHANDFVASRTHKERILDALLRRDRGDGHVMAVPEVRDAIDARASRDVPFIVVATPVEEIGRDHDFDWAVIDVSSAQSLVQAAGRVNRHRLIDCAGRPNVAVLRFNHRRCTNNAKPDASTLAAFVRPGHESLKAPRVAGRCPYRRHAHDLARLLPWRPDATLPVDARLRFDRDCALASADDAAIVAELERYFGPEGHFVRDSPSAWLLTQGDGSPYDRTPLRKREGIEHILRIHGSLVQPRFDRLVPIARAGRGWPIVAALPVAVGVVRPPVHNAWLVCDVPSMEAIARSAGVETQDALKVRLNAYDGQPVSAFEFDGGFGFHLPPPA